MLTKHSVRNGMLFSRGLSKLAYHFEKKYAKVAIFIIEKYAKLIKI